MLGMRKKQEKKPSANTKRVVTVRVSVPEHARLFEIAESRGQTASQLGRFVIREFIAAQEDKNDDK